MFKAIALACVVSLSSCLAAEFCPWKSCDATASCVAGYQCVVDVKQANLNVCRPAPAEAGKTGFYGNCSGGKVCTKGSSCVKKTTTFSECVPDTHKECVVTAKPTTAKPTAVSTPSTTHATRPPTTHRPTVIQTPTNTFPTRPPATQKPTPTSTFPTRPPVTPKPTTPKPTKAENNYADNGKSCPWKTCKGNALGCSWGWYCRPQDKYYSQCAPMNAGTAVEFWKKCAGVGGADKKTCATSATCVAQNDYYSICVPWTPPGCDTLG